MELFSSYYRNVAFQLSLLVPKDICILLIQNLKQIEFNDSKKLYLDDMIVEVIERPLWSQDPYKWGIIHKTKIIHKKSNYITWRNISYLQKLFNQINNKEKYIYKIIIGEINYRRRLLKFINEYN